MPRRRREPREVLILPISALVSVVWALSAVTGAMTGDFQFLEVTSGPFVLMCGYVFGVKIIRNGYSDGDPPTRSTRRRERGD